MKKIFIILIFILFPHSSIALEEIELNPDKLITLSPIAKSINNMSYTQNKTNMYAQDIDRVDNKIDNLENDMYSGLATVTALTSLHPNPRSDGLIDISLGSGVYRDEFAGALGIFIHPTKNFMIQGGASISDESYAGFIGLTFSFGKRKD